jgi:hypothetical protein
MVEVRLYVEGGGTAKILRTACREGFSAFLNRAGLAGHMPRIVACGGRQEAYDDFCTAVRGGMYAAMLLVDSESPVTVPTSWLHLLNRPGDHWRRPSKATDEDCHLMVQCMESWFLTDPQTLASFFGQGFKIAALPLPSTNVEIIEKERVYQILDDATQACKTKGAYGKGEHSFKLLARIDPANVTARSVWAAHFVANLKARMGS